MRPSWCVVASITAPGKYMVVQTPDLGLMEAWLWHLTAIPNYLTLIAEHFDDRFEALEQVRERFAAVATKRQNHTPGVAEWFAMPSSEDAYFVLADFVRPRKRPTTTAA